MNELNSTCLMSLCGAFCATVPLPGVRKLCIVALNSGSLSPRRASVFVSHKFYHLLSSGKCDSNAAHLMTFHFVVVFFKKKCDDDFFLYRLNVLTINPTNIISIVNVQFVAQQFNQEIQTSCSRMCQTGMKFHECARVNSQEFITCITLLVEHFFFWFNKDALLIRSRNKLNKIKLLEVYYC